MYQNFIFVSGCSCLGLHLDNFKGDFFNIYFSAKKKEKVTGQIFISNLLIIQLQYEKRMAGSQNIKNRFG